MIVTIIVAIIGAIGASIGGGFAFAQFMIKRKDEKEKENVQKQIDDAVRDAKTELVLQFTKGLQEREDTGKERFDINSKAIKENTEQIKELTGLVKEQVQQMSEFSRGMTSLTKMARLSAESQRNSNYDRILIVANKVLKDGKITITEKTNIKQLYTSWQEFHGEGEKPDPKILTLYEECMKLPIVADEGV